MKQNKYIVKLITLSGLTAIELCKRSGFKTSQLSDWKNSRAGIGLNNFLKLCEAGNVEPVKVFEDGNE